MNKKTKSPEETAKEFWWYEMTDAKLNDANTSQGQIHNLTVLSEALHLVCRTEQSVGIRGFHNVKVCAETLDYVIGKLNAIGRINDEVQVLLGNGSN